MGHIVIHLSAAIGTSREFILEAQNGRIRVTYSIASTPIGDTLVSIQQFSLNDLFSLIQEVYGLDVRLLVEKQTIKPEVKRKLGL